MVVVLLKNIPQGAYIRWCVRKFTAFRGLIFLVKKPLAAACFYVCIVSGSKWTSKGMYYYTSLYKNSVIE